MKEITLTKRINLIFSLLLKGCILEEDLFGYKIAMGDDYSVGYLLETRRLGSDVIYRSITGDFSIGRMISILSELSNEEFLEKTIKYSMYALLDDV